MGKEGEWLTAYNNTLSLADEIEQLLQERNRLRSRNVNTTKKTMQLKNHLRQLQNELEVLRKLLTKERRSSKFSDREYNRRLNLIEALVNRKDQMAEEMDFKSLARDHERGRLLGDYDDEISAVETDRTRPLDNGQLVSYQQDIMRKQDEHLDKLSHSVLTTKHVTQQIHDELDVHNRLLDELEEGVDSTGSKIKKESSNMKDVFIKSKDGPYYWIIVGLIVFIIILVFVAVGLF
eukprot:Rmarinus@m.7115